MQLILKKFSVTSFALLFLLAAITFGQNNDVVTQKTLWRSRADAISGNLLRGSSKITELQRALLFARLGNLWLKSDKSQSNKWFEKSVDAVFFYSPKDTETDKKEYFDTTRNILSVISNNNQTQTNRLLKILSDTDKSSEDEKGSNANALISYALQIVKENPAKATQIGITALRVGHPKEFYKLIWELRRSNPTLADQLFREAFSIAKNSPDYYRLQGIQYAVLPESVISGFPANLSASPSQKIEVLNFFADYLVQRQAGYLTKTIPSCSSEAILIARSNKLFESLLPQKAGIVRQAIDACTDVKAQSAFENLEKPSKDLDIEELLDVADENKNNRLVRIGYLTKAVLLANVQKKYALVLKIVDNLSEEELAEDRDFWEEMRYDAAGNLAYIQFRDGDLQSSNKTLEDISTAYRPFAQTVFVIKSASEDKANYSYQVGVLNNAEKGFIKSEKPFGLKLNYWLQLVKLYSKYKLYNQAAETFREIIKSYNNALSEKESSQIQLDSATITAVFSPALLEAQENSIFETANSVSETTSRINVYLAFLNIALQKYESLNSVSTKNKS